ncbi:MAG: STAS domain-containing protein [Coxiellaceae bacterium]|nr:STAS domain-containing protein [Coxiellaceae bacterium]
MTTQLTCQGNQLRLEGELTFMTVNKLYDRGPALMDSLQTIIIDLQNVSRCDSSALALLISWQRYASHCSKSITFAHVPQQLLAVAEVCGIKEHFKQFLQRVD